MNVVIILAIAALLFSSFALGFNFALYLVRRDQGIAEERK